MSEPTWIEELVTTDLRLALGDLVIAAADVENIIYNIARIYRIDQPEKMSARRAAGKLQARVGVLSIPPWSDASRPKLIAWCGAARAMLDHRDRHIHAGMHFRSQVGTDSMKTVRFSLRDGQSIESTVDHVRLVVSQLLRVRRAGMILEFHLCVPEPDGGYLRPPYIGDLPLSVKREFEAHTAWADWAAKAAGQ